MKKSLAFFAIASLGLAPVFCTTDGTGCSSCKPTEQKKPVDATNSTEKKMVLVLDSNRSGTDKSESSTETSSTTTQLIADTNKSESSIETSSTTTQLIADTNKSESSTETSSTTTQLIADADKKAEATCDKCGGAIKDGKCAKCGSVKKVSSTTQKIAFA